MPFMSPNQKTQSTQGNSKSTSGFQSLLICQMIPLGLIHQMTPAWSDYAALALNLAKVNNKSLQNW